MSLNKTDSRLSVFNQQLALEDYAKFFNKFLNQHLELDYETDGGRYLMPGSQAGSEFSRLRSWDGDNVEDLDILSSYANDDLLAKAKSNEESPERRLIIVEQDSGLSTGNITREYLARLALASLMLDSQRPNNQIVLFSNRQNTRVEQYVEQYPETSSPQSKLDLFDNKLGDRRLKEQNIKGLSSTIHYAIDKLMYDQVDQLVLISSFNETETNKKPKWFKELGAIDGRGIRIFRIFDPAFVKLPKIAGLFANNQEIAEMDQILLSSLNSDANLQERQQKQKYITKLLSRYQPTILSTIDMDRHLVTKLSN